MYLISDLNLLHWGSLNQIALALAGAVYIWNPITGETHHLIQMENEDYISSVSWIGHGSVLAVGNSSGQVQVKRSCSVCLLCKYSIFHSKIIITVAACFFPPLNLVMGCCTVYLCPCNGGPCCKGGVIGLELLHPVKVTKYQ